MVIWFIHLLTKNELVGIDDLRHSQQLWSYRDVTAIILPKL